MQSGFAFDFSKSEVRLAIGIGALECPEYRAASAGRENPEKEARFRKRYFHSSHMVVLLRGNRVTQLGK